MPLNKFMVDIQQVNGKNSAAEFVTTSATIILVNIAAATKRFIMGQAGANS